MKIRSFEKFFALLFLVFLAFSCSSIKGSLERLGFRNYKSVYVRDLKIHTRSYTLYRDFSTIAKATVTRFNKKLFEEYVQSIKNISEDEVKAKYKSYLEEFDKYDIYYVAFYTPDMELNNLEEINSFWNVYLNACGKVGRPESINWMEKNDWRSSWLYSTKNSRWSREYIIKFNKSKCKDTIFVLSSFLGTISLKF